MEGSAVWGYHYHLRSAAIYFLNGPNAIKVRTGHVSPTSGSQEVFLGAWLLARGRNWVKKTFVSPCPSKDDSLAGLHGPIPAMGTIRGLQIPLFSYLGALFPLTPPSAPHQG